MSCGCFVWSFVCVLVWEAAAREGGGNPRGPFSDVTAGLYRKRHGCCDVVLDSGVLAL